MTKTKAHREIGERQSGLDSNNSKGQEPMRKESPEELFKGQFIGMFDMNGKPIHEGDTVKLYYKGEFFICKIIYVPEWAMFCLQWPDGYKNKFPISPEYIQVVS